MEIEHLIIPLVHDFNEKCKLHKSMKQIEVNVADTACTHVPTRQQDIFTLLKS